MRRFWFPFGMLALLAVALTRPTAARPADQPPPPKADDADALRKAGLDPDDGPALVARWSTQTRSWSTRPKRQPALRKPLPEHFPRVDHLIPVPEAQRECRTLKVNSNC